jgi:hypothetical protein
MHVNTTPYHEPNHPPDIRNTSTATGTSAHNAMDITDNSDTDDAPFSQAFEQSLFFLRQSCPESHLQQLESEIQNNQDITELQALVYQWVTNPQPESPSAL